MSAFTSAMDATNTPKKARGENGAPELTAAGVGSNLLALFARLVRGLPESELKPLLGAAAADAASPADIADLFVLAFQTAPTR